MSKLKKLHNTKVSRKMVRYEYQAPKMEDMDENNASTDEGKNGRDILGKENSEKSVSVRKIFDRKSSHSKANVAVYQTGLMDKLIHQQNYLARGRTQKERPLSKSRSSRMTTGHKECKDTTDMKGESGDSKCGNLSVPKTKNLKPAEGFIIKKTKINDSDIFEITNATEEVEDCADAGEKEKIQCKQSNTDLYRRVVAMQENNRLIKEENHSLKKRLRRVQELKVDNYVLSEKIVKLENEVELLTDENKEMRKNLTLLQDLQEKSILNVTANTKSSPSYTISTLVPGVKADEEVSELPKSYSNRLLKMEERVADIVSILEIMKSVVVEQKIASENTEKLFHQFMAEINTVSLLRNVFQEFTSSKSPKSTTTE